MRRILTIGGGVGGMAFAIHGAEQGLDVEIIEADPNWRVAGAGITISGPTYRALARLGMLDEVVAAGFFVKGGAVMCSPDGVRISEVPMRQLAPGLPASGGILRPTLHTILSDRVRAKGTKVRLGETVTSLVDDPDGVTATFSSGDQQRYDVVVGADGAFSDTRRMIFPHAPEPAYTGQYCWRILARRPDDFVQPHFFVGSQYICGLVPVSQEKMYMWLLEAQPKRRRISDDEIAPMLLAMLDGFGGPIDAVRESIAAGEPIIARPLDALLMPLPWHRGRTILIGDAAHATTPHLASGAGIAVEGAIVLAELLGESGSIEDAFARYEQRRWERCRLVVEESVAIGRMQQVGNVGEAFNQRMRNAQAVLEQDI